MLRYRYTSAEGEVVDAYWLTDYPTSAIGSEALFRLAKNRWEIENQGFNDAKNRYGFLHRGSHACTSAADLVALLWLALGRPALHDTS